MSDFAHILNIDEHRLLKMGNDEIRAIASRTLQHHARMRQELALCFYKPVSESARKVHLSTAQTFAAFGGNGSSKTESSLVDLVICATGIIPDDLKEDYPREKLRGPINCRVVVESLTTTLHPIILPKLRYSQWDGIDEPGGDRGHWGWIPRQCLIQGNWQKSWSEKLRMLRVLYRNPDNPEQVIGESRIQFMSHDQDPEDFASGNFHIIMHDEPPSLPIWREDEARTMRVNGRMTLAMTWPDDPSVNVEWIHDEILEQDGKEGSGVEVVVLDTTDNPHLDQQAVALQANKWDEETRRVRIHGGHVRFSNLVHPLFTDVPSWWCFSCNQRSSIRNDACGHCGSQIVSAFSHVEAFDPQPWWPVVQLIDPHPRKPHYLAWIATDPNDDFYQVAELLVEGDPTDVYQASQQVERDMDLRVVKRIIDPRMGNSPSNASRQTTWQGEFDQVGLRCDRAEIVENSIGQRKINEWLKPDRSTKRPRAKIHPNCPKTIFQFKRFCWDDFKKGTDKDQKQRPKEKHDDFPALWRYFSNEDPKFSFLQHGAEVIHRHPAQSRARRARVG